MIYAAKINHLRRKGCIRKADYLLSQMRRSHGAIALHRLRTDTQGILEIQREACEGLQVQS